MTQAYLLGGVRTPFARYGGSLSHLRLDDLLGFALAGACERVGVDRDQIEDIIAGCVNPAHEGMGDLARWAALAAGFPDRAAGATINRFCGSSLSATAMIAHAIKAGDLGVGIACGAESMSRSGFAYMKGEAPFSPRGPQLLLDTMWSGAGGPPNPVLLGRNAYIGMIETAQNVADRYQLSREEIDAFALRSQQHARAARDSGRLAKEIMPVTIPATRKTPRRTVSHDEFIRDDTTLEQLAGLPAQPGTTQMTAGNSTPLSDGAAAAILASARTGRRPRRRPAGPGGVLGRLRQRSTADGHRPGLGATAGAATRGLDPRTDRRMGNPRGLQRASPGCPTRAAQPTRRIPGSRRQTHPQRGCRGHRASVRRHRRTLRTDPSHRTTRTTSALRRHRGMYRLRPRCGYDSGKPTSRLTATSRPHPTSPDAST